MTLQYTTKAGGDKSVVVPFDPPLAGYEEVKPRLLAMKVDAEDALGMVSEKTINLKTSPNDSDRRLPLV
jgi:hypothetical protein